MFVFDANVENEVNGEVSDSVNLVAHFCQFYKIVTMIRLYLLRKLTFMASLECLINLY